MEERLQKFIASSGIASRRQAEDMIIEGRVKVNGTIVKLLGTKVTPNDIVEVDGTIIKKQDTMAYYLLNKPEGYISTTSDDRNRRTVMDLIKGIPETVYPVGRLDYDSSGLLVFTNDRQLMEGMLNPINEIEREYHVTITGLLRRNESYAIQRGIVIDGVKTKRCMIYNVKYNKEKTSTSLDIVLTEGKNREIRRLFSSFNHEVKTLKRTRFGNIILDVRKGEYRRMKPYEIKMLKLVLGNPQFKNNKNNKFYK